MWRINWKLKKRKRTNKKPASIVDAGLVLSNTTKLVEKDPIKRGLAPQF